MRILSKQFNVKWSWTGIAIGLFKQLPEYEWITEDAETITDGTGYDAILCQQVSILKNIKTGRYKTVCRLGGNYSFEDGHKPGYKDLMRQVCAIIATNRKLFNIAKRYNPNTFLIPNGLDLEEWGVLPEKTGEFTAGFVGNIITPYHRDYKGFDFVEPACQELSIPLKTALYKEKQIPHGQMREQFYCQVSCIVHPTRGEGCSNTIMEALACGIPVITTKAAGFHGEMLEHGKNVLFCERSRESIKECLSWLIKDRQLYERLKINGRKFAERYHDIAMIAKEYEAILQACYEANKNKKGEDGMKIKYTGPKPVKKVLYNNREYTFDPECNVKDPETIKFLLDPARGGLFEIVEPEPLPVKLPEPVEDSMQEKPAVPTGYPCPYCTFKAESKIGLTSHIRHKHKPGKQGKRGKR